MDKNQDSPAGSEACDWNQLAPLLDEAMSSLSSKDRDAVVLRCFEGRSLRAVGEMLGISEGAAGKRVSRALERLRGNLSRRGVTTSVAGLAAVIGTNAVKAEVPSGLLQTVAANALVPTKAISPLLVPHGLSALIGAAVVGTAMVGASFVSEVTTPVLASRSGSEERKEGGAPGWRNSRHPREPGRDRPPEAESVETIVAEIGKVAQLPETRRRTAELEELVRKIHPSDLAQAAERLHGYDGPRAVWLRIMPILFGRWSQFETEAALEFCAVSLRNHGERRMWGRMIGAWETSQAPAARNWFLKAARGEAEMGLLRKGGFEKTGALIALKSVDDFESFLSALPELPGTPMVGEQTTLAQAVRADALYMVGRLSIEDRRRWAETLTDPRELSRVIESMFHSVASARREETREEGSAELRNLADWAWDQLPADGREASMVGVVMALNREDVHAAIRWFGEKGSEADVQGMAMRIVTYKNFPRPRPQVQLAWADAIPDARLREDAAAGVFRRWCRDQGRDTQSPASYLSTADLSPARRARFEEILKTP